MNVTLSYQHLFWACPIGSPPLIPCGLFSFSLIPTHKPGKMNCTKWSTYPCTSYCPAQLHSAAQEMVLKTDEPTCIVQSQTCASRFQIACPVRCKVPRADPALVYNHCSQFTEHPQTSNGILHSHILSVSQKLLQENRFYPIPPLIKKLTLISKTSGEDQLQTQTWSAQQEYSILLHSNTVTFK